MSTISQNNPQFNHNKVIINKTYVLNNHKKSIQNYNVYDGINFREKSPITAFIKMYKPSDNQKFNKQLNLKLNSISCKILWSGQQTINKRLYRIQILQKLGPSLKQVLQLFNYNIPINTIYHLVYNILKMLQKLNQLKLVYRRLKFSKIFLSKNPNQSDLYFLEYIQTKRIGQHSKKINSKYSSIGSHLGLDASYKDDLQSLCYMIFDLLNENKLFIIKNKQQLLNKKLQMKLLQQNNKKIPIDIIQFYYYVRNLSNNQQPNYQFWKKIFKNKIMLSSILSNNTMNRIYIWSYNLNNNSMLEKSHTLESKLDIVKIFDQTKSQIQNYDDNNQQNNYYQQQQQQQCYNNTMTQTFQDEQTINEKLIKTSLSTLKSNNICMI